MAGILVSALLAAADQACKERADKRLEEGQTVSLLDGRVVLKLVRNRGMMCGVMKDDEKTVRVLSIAATAVVGICWLILLFQRGGFFAKRGASLLLAGAVSNLADRLRRGYVVDYITFPQLPGKMGKLTYNIADLMIFAGAFLMVLSVLFRRK